MIGLTKETVWEDLRQLDDCSEGCRYWRVDLHTHTPASSDSRWDDDTTPHDIVAAYAQRGISLIAVTDHSTGEWVDSMKKAGRSYSKRHKIPFTVLPGIELYAEGIHILVIFPERLTSRKMMLFLGRLELRDSDFGREGAAVDKTISEIAIEAQKDGGILIGAHCNSSKGVIESLKGKKRIAILKALDLLEIRADQDHAKSGKSIDYVRLDLSFPDIPIVFSSDSHSAKEIIENVSLVKMDH